MSAAQGNWLCVREELKYKDRAEYGKLLIANLAKDLNVGERLLYEIVKLLSAFNFVYSTQKVV